MPPCDPPHSACGDPGPINYVNSSSSSSRSSRLNCFALNQNEQRTGPNRDYQRQLPGRRFGPKAAQKPSRATELKGKKLKTKEQLGAHAGLQSPVLKKGRTDGRGTTYNLQPTNDNRQPTTTTSTPGRCEKKNVLWAHSQKGPKHTHRHTHTVAHRKRKFSEDGDRSNLLSPFIHPLSPPFPRSPFPFRHQWYKCATAFSFFFCRVVCQNNMLKHRCEECCFFNLVVFYFPKRFAKVEKGCQKWGFPFFVTLFVFPFDFCCLCLPSVCNFSFSGCI